LSVSHQLIKDFKRLISETDIVQLHYPYPFTEILTLINRINKPIVMTFHGELAGRDLLLKFYRPFQIKLFQKLNVVVPTNSNLVKTTPILQKFKDKCYVINLWLDTNRFERLEDVSNDFKNQIEKFGDFALFVGVLRWYKGLDYLLEAAKKYKGKVVVVGKGPEMKHLNQRIQKEKIHNVILLGYKPDEEVAYLFKKCAFFVLPSQTRGECFGQVLLEASYYHKPMISTELGTGTSIANKHEFTGFVVRNKDVEELANRMNQLQEDIELRNQMGENAYNYYQSHFTEQIQGIKYMYIYDKLLSGQNLSEEGQGY
jgi:rhamnosyl/mannosyltransferase